MFPSEIHTSQDSLSVMASVLDKGLEKEVYESVIKASQGILTGVECAEDYFRFKIRQKSYGEINLTLRKEILMSSFNSPYLAYSIDGVEARGYLDAEVNDPLMLDVVLRVKKLQFAPLEELDVLNGVLRKAFGLITKQ